MSNRILKSSSMYGVLAWIALLGIIFIAAAYVNPAAKAEAGTPSLLKPKPSIQSVLETRYGQKYPESLILSVIVKDASVKEGLDETLILAMMKAESSFNPKAISNMGARGYLQVMPVWSSVCPYDMYNQYGNILQGACAMKHSIFQAGSVGEGLVVYNIGMPNYSQGVSLVVGRAFRDTVLREQKELERIL